MSTLPSNERLLELVGELDHYAETEGYERGYPGGLYSGQRQRARAELEAGIRALTSHETVEQRDGPSTCRQEGHDWKVTCSDCGEVRPIPYVHLNSGGHDRDAKIYSVRDVEALLAVGEAMSRHAQKAETGALLCRYCPARFMTAWEHEIHEKEHAQKALLVGGDKS